MNNPVAQIKDMPIPNPEMFHVSVLQIFTALVRNGSTTGEATIRTSVNTAVLLHNAVAERLQDAAKA